MGSLLAPFEQVFTELRPSKESGLPGVTWGVLSLTTALTLLGAVPRQPLHSKLHNFLPTPPIEVFLGILESQRHEPCNALGLTFVTPSLRGWEAFPTPGGPHPH